MNILTFYVSEQHYFAGKPLYEWLLETAKNLGISGGSAFRAIAGYGRHGKLHEDTFFELAGELAVKVEFILDDEHATKLLTLLGTKSLKVFYTQQQVFAGITKSE